MQPSYYVFNLPSVSVDGFTSVVSLSIDLVGSVVVITEISGSLNCAEYRVKQKQISVITCIQGETKTDICHYMNTG